MQYQSIYGAVMYTLDSKCIKTAWWPNSWRENSRGEERWWREHDPNNYKFTSRAWSHIDVECIYIASDWLAYYLSIWCANFSEVSTLDESGPAETVSVVYRLTMSLLISDILCVLLMLNIPLVKRKIHAITSAATYGSMCCCSLTRLSVQCETSALDTRLKFPLHFISSLAISRKTPVTVDHVCSFVSSRVRLLPSGRTPKRRRFRCIGLSPVPFYTNNVIWKRSYLEQQWHSLPMSYSHPERRFKALVCWFHKMVKLLKTTQLMHASTIIDE